MFENVGECLFVCIRSNSDQKLGKIIARFWLNDVLYHLKISSHTKLLRTEYDLDLFFKKKDDLHQYQLVTTCYFWNFST